MNYYLIAKYIHIVGALGMFAALGVEWLSLMNVRRAAGTAQFREWDRIGRGMQWLSGPSMAAILVSGFYMMAVARMHAAWLVVAFGMLIVMGLLGGAVVNRRMKVIRQAMSQETGPISAPLQQLLRQPVLWTIMQIRVALLLGVVFLMTVKPGIAGSLLTVGLAIGLGLASALPLPGRALLQNESAD